MAALGQGKPARCGALPPAAALGHRADLGAGLARTPRGRRAAAQHRAGGPLPPAGAPLRAWPSHHRGPAAAAVRLGLRPVQPARAPRRSKGGGAGLRAVGHTRAAAGGLEPQAHGAGGVERLRGVQCPAVALLRPRPAFHGPALGHGRRPWRRGSDRLILARHHAHVRGQEPGPLAGQPDRAALPGMPRFASGHGPRLPGPMAPWCPQGARGGE
mmetsp:Transcript_155123/g.476517  ORF Transcript_155123/g.476517 Transcript_155123/m.476517 type:complete len:214 (+) Transcript_155123:364-1005(+)